MFHQVFFHIFGILVNLDAFSLSLSLSLSFFLFIFILLFIQNTSHRSLLRHTNYTKHIIHTGPTHETHKTPKRFFGENIRNTYTQQEKESFSSYISILAYIEGKSKLFCIYLQICFRKGNFPHPSE